MVNQTALPHTHENQQILRMYGEKTVKKFGDQSVTQERHWYSFITDRLPSSATVGGIVGQGIGWTHGARWSNAAIDLVVSRFFQVETKPKSFWESLGSFFWGATETTVSETLKIAITPKALPYIALMTGAVGAVALPAVVSLVTFAYNKVMNDPYKLHQLSKMSLDKLFTIDPETGRWRDAFGRLMSADDMKDIVTAAAKYDLIRKLIELCHEIDHMDKEDDEMQVEAKKLIKVLVKSYCIKRSDGAVMFPDGSKRTEEEKLIIQQGINDLSRINPTHRAKRIHRMIKVLASHTMMPAETLSPADKLTVNTPSLGKETVEPKRMPAVFPEGKQEWKNSIIRTSDGKYVISQDIGDKKKGTMLSAKEMEAIFDELQVIQNRLELEKQESLYQSMMQPKQHGALVEQLNLMSGEEIKSILGSYVVQRQKDGQFVYFNGETLSAEEHQKFKQSLALIPTRRDMKNRAKKIKKIVKQLGTHLPKDTEESQSKLIKCYDGVYINHEGVSLHEFQVKQQVLVHKKVKEAVLDSEINDFFMIEKELATVSIM